jgi:hypothetical protein
MHPTIPMIVLLSGCAPTDYHECEKTNYVSLTLRGEDWYGIGDNILHMRVFETKDGWVEQSEQTPLNEEGTLNYVFECGLDDGASYTVTWYINTNDDFGCQREDQVWSDEIGIVNDDLMMEISPDDPEDNAACRHF